MDDFGCLKSGDRLLHDRDGKFMWSGFRYKLQNAGIQCLPLPPRSPNLNAFAERFVRSVKEECTSHFIFISRHHVERVLREYFAFYNHERPHQGKDIGGELLLPAQGRDALKARTGPVQKKSRLGGLLNDYYRLAA